MLTSRLPCKFPVGFKKSLTGSSRPKTLPKEPAAERRSRQGEDSMQDEAVRIKAPAFDWEDPFLLDEQLSPEERMIRDTAREYCQSKLAPRIIEAYLQEKTDRAIFDEMGAL